MFSILGSVVGCADVEEGIEEVSLMWFCYKMEMGMNLLCDKIGS